jgi:hypothetical protein
MGTSPSRRSGGRRPANADGCTHGCLKNLPGDLANYAACDACGMHVVSLASKKPLRVFNNRVFVRPQASSIGGGGVARGRWLNLPVIINPDNDNDNAAGSCTTALCRDYNVDNNFRDENIDHIRKPSYKYPTRQSSSLRSCCCYMMLVALCVYVVAASILLFSTAYILTATMSTMSPTDDPPITSIHNNLTTTT